MIKYYYTLLTFIHQKRTVTTEGKKKNKYVNCTGSH